MPKNCIKFISGFLIPSLDNKKFGSRLKWIDKSKKKFQMDWLHKGGPSWTEKEAAVFVEWDKHKGHFKPGDKMYYTKSKQRFRSLLYKLTQQGQLLPEDSEDKFRKIYRIDEKKCRRKRKSQDFNAEYELCNEEDSSEEEKFDDSLDEECKKQDALTALEDHSYSIIDNAVINSTDTENAELINCLGSLMATSLPEFSENFEKRVLVERNTDYENINTPINPHENLEVLSYEDLQNVFISRPTGKLQDPYFMPVDQNKLFLENIIYSDIHLSNPQTLFQNMEFLDPSLLNLDGTLN